MPEWVTVARRNERILRALLAAAACLAGMRWFVGAVSPHYAVGSWFFWSLLKVWTVCGVFAATCAAGGGLVMTLGGFRTMALRERAVFGFATGMLCVFVLMFAGGLLGLYGPGFAVMLPAAIIAAGAWFRRHRLQRTWFHLRAWRARPRPAAAWWTGPALAFGALGLVLVYLPLLTPQNIAFDSHFYHLGIAQQYYTQGGIYPSPEGWTPLALPHLASILYTWALLVPGLTMPERLLAAAHVEWVVFLFTLLSIPVLVRWLVPGAGRLSWVCLFLFPGIFVYDSNLSAAADHINAAWAIPIFLALRRAVVTWSPRDSALLAAMLSGAVLTKYQAMYLVAFPLLAYAGMGAWSLVAASRGGSGTPSVRHTARTLLRAAAAATATGVVLTAPHWLKNWAFYGDPLYPFLHKYMGSDAWGPGYGALFEDWQHWQIDKWRPKGSTGERMGKTLRALVNFSVKPNDWPTFHGKWPVFGSLFTLCTAPLLFLKGAKRTWLVVVATYLGVGIWYWTMHQDRYLQNLLPWMAAMVAATGALVWRAHWSARPAFVALLGLQIVWGGDAPFIKSHVISKRAPAAAGTDVLGAGYRKKTKGRLDVPTGLFQVAKKAKVPQGATVLIHENNPRLGLWRPVVADIAGWQFGLRYDLYRSALEVHHRLRFMKVDYVLTRDALSRGFDSLGADLVFFDYAAHHAEAVRTVGKWSVLRLGEAPAEKAYGPVLYTGCGKLYERGLHPTTALNVRETQVRERPARIRATRPLGKKGGYAPLLKQAQFVVTEAQCEHSVPRKELKGFDLIAKRKKHRLWSRRHKPEAGN